MHFNHMTPIRWQRKRALYRTKILLPLSANTMLNEARDRRTWLAQLLAGANKHDIPKDIRYPMAIFDRVYILATHWRCSQRNRNVESINRRKIPFKPSQSDLPYRQCALPALALHQCRPQR